MDRQSDMQAAESEIDPRLKKPVQKQGIGIREQGLGTKGLGD
jgi:hypothetical protein